MSPAGRDWGQPNRTNPGAPNAYAEYLAYKQKVQARQQSLALEQALQQLLEQEQAARAVAGPQAFAYNGADGFTGSGYETGGAAGAGDTGSSGEIDGGYAAGDLFKQGGSDGGSGIESASPATDTGGATGQVLNEGEAETGKAKGKDVEFGSNAKSEQKLNNQMNKRGWTEQSVRDTVDSPYTTRKSINKATGNPSTVYYTKEGSYVIVDDITKEIVQVSDNINPSTWAPDASIVNPYIPE